MWDGPDFPLMEDVPLGFIMADPLVAIGDKVPPQEPGSSLFPSAKGPCIRCVAGKMSAVRYLMCMAKP